MSLVQHPLSIICAVTGHRPAERRIRGRSHDYAECSTCGSDIVRSTGEKRWAVDPAGNNSRLTQH